jgi:hypothetical protein
MLPAQPFGDLPFSQSWSQRARTVGQYRPDGAPSGLPVITLRMIHPYEYVCNDSLSIPQHTVGLNTQLIAV